MTKNCFNFRIPSVKDQWQKCWTAIKISKELNFVSSLNLCINYLSSSPEKCSFLSINRKEENERDVRSLWNWRWNRSVESRWRLIGYIRHPKTVAQQTSIYSQSSAFIQPTKKHHTSETSCRGSSWQSFSFKQVPGRQRRLQNDA